MRQRLGCGYRRRCNFWARAGGRPVNPWLLDEEDEEDELVIGWRNRGVEAVKESDGFFSCYVVVVLVYLENVDRGGVVGWAAHT